MEKRGEKSEGDRQLDQYFKINADPDPGRQTNADPDPGQCFAITKVLFLLKEKNTGTVKSPNFVTLLV
jgi:hypothetical protein